MDAGDDGVTLRTWRARPGECVCEVDCPAPIGKRDDACPSRLQIRKTRIINPSC